MKTKLLFCAIQNFKNVLKLKGIFTFLIIFFMTFTSFSQSDGITFDCDGTEVIFGTPDGTDQAGYLYWSNGTFGFSLYVEIDPIEGPVWALHAPGNGILYPDPFHSPGELYWYSPINENPSLCDATWTFSFASCNELIVTCTGGPPDEEVCDGIDNDGDGQIDEDLDFITYYADSDGDGFGDSSNSVSTCDGAPPGFVEDNTDCDDLEFDVNPGAPEICDGLDNNCDGQIDEGIDGCIDGVIIEYCDDKQKKILVCHNGKTKCVSINAMDAHLAHGDYLGTCGGNSKQEEVLAEERPTSYNLVSWPNPTNDLFNVKMITPNDDDIVSLQVFDINGRLIHSNIINGNEDYQFGHNIQAGVYFVKVTQANTTEVIKVIKR